MSRSDPKRGPIVEALEQGVRILRILILLGLLAFALSGIKSIQPNEAAVVLRFGHVVGETRAEQVHAAGLLLALPYPIDEVVRLPVRDIREITIDEFTPRRRLPGFGSIDPTEEGYCLTGDQYIVQLSGTVKYQIADPVAYALHQTDPEGRVRGAVMAEILRSIGEMGVDNVLTKGKKLLASRVLERCQQRLDDPETGVLLIAVELNELMPPPAVRQAFQDVVSASIEKETMIKEARRYRSERILEAETSANSMIRKAEAYRKELLSRCRGEVIGFRSVRKAYEEGSEVVRVRLFREAMEDIFERVGGKFVVPGERDGERPPTVRLIVPGKE